MTKTVLFVEKKAIANYITKALELKKVNETLLFFEVEPSPAFPKGAIVTWGGGGLFRLAMLITIERIPKEHEALINREKQLYGLTATEHYFNTKEPISLPLLKDVYDNYFAELSVKDHIQTLVHFLRKSDTIIHAHDGDTMNVEMFNLLCSLIGENAEGNYCYDKDNEPKKRIVETTFFTLEREVLMKCFEDVEHLSDKEYFGINDIYFEKVHRILNHILKS